MLTCGARTRSCQPAASQCHGRSWATRWTRKPDGTGSGGITSAMVFLLLCIPVCRYVLRQPAAAISPFIAPIWPEAIDLRQCLFCPAGPQGSLPSREESGRSEEHTSELQSLMRISYAVFCLKKNTQQHNMNERLSTQD